MGSRHGQRPEYKYTFLENRAAEDAGELWEVSGSRLSRAETSPALADDHSTATVARTFGRPWRAGTDPALTDDDDLATIARAMERTPARLSLRSVPDSDYFMAGDDTEAIIVHDDPDNESFSRVPPGDSQEEWDISEYHCHVPRPGKNKLARNQLLAVSFICFIFMVGEIVGGTLANSLALITDATHLASDLTGFLVSLVAIWIGSRPPTTRMSFGFYRAEVLGAVISVLIIWLTTIILFYLAVKRVISMDFVIEPDSMLITAGCGVAFNIIMGIVLNVSAFGCGSVAHAHGHGHSHGGQGHGHSKSKHAHNHMTGADQSGTPKRGHREVNINVRAAFIHVIGDFIQSIGVFIAALVIKFCPDCKIADPICTFVFSILVLITTITILRDTLLVLLEAVPRDVNYRQMKLDIESLGGVQSAHTLNVWSLTMDKNAVAVHLAVDAGVDRNALLQQTTTMLRTKYRTFHSTVQVEEYQASIMTKCDQCLGPKNC